MFKKLTASALAAVLLLAAPAHFAAGEMSAEEILKKSNEAMAELDSYSTHMQMEQMMDMGGEEMSISSESEVDITVDPFAMHMVTTTMIPEEGEVSLESYLTDEGFFQEDPVEGWVKMPNEFSDSLSELAGMGMVEEQMAQLEALGEEMSVEDQGDSYLLTYEGDGEAVMEASREMLGSMMQDEESGEMMNELMNQMTINSLKYEVTIDKDNHYMTGTVMEMDTDMNMDGETINSVINMNMTVDNFNGVGEITVPEEVLSSATPMEDMMPEETEGGELPNTSTSYPTMALSGLALMLGGAFIFHLRSRKPSES
ncbi:LPXTG cell wall anchor domain-containing protein [Halobacillus massiliensis]|uniref:LPXTG cell wall anchor domain-containing protein n=1 Tax=Halobacillus massiliensis TaxID=1926286 RepID=UPI0009E31A9F|nr:LPXTG cell wall anchor domain-containing protein [Halobacillus massiliensis]